MIFVKFEFSNYNFQIAYKMGSSFVKDEKLDIYMEVHKPFYYPGEIVEGCIYINAKATRNYRNLIVRLTGVEHVYWSEGSGKNRRSYSNTYQNYDNIFGITDFNGTVEQGHYIFPFSFLLPNSMSGSYNYSDSCYIRYTLKALLNHIKQEKQSQFYDLYLNIIQPPRMPLGAMQIQNTVNAKCCGCCMDYGVTNLNLNCDKNFAMNGDSITVTGVIDHSGGKSQIENGRVTFDERRVVISSGGSLRNRHDSSILIGSINKIQPGRTQNFHFQARVPENIVNYTAIGRVTARFFVIAVHTQIGCCANSPYVQLHMIINSKTPQVMKQNKMPPPTNWYPREGPKVVCNNMKPFVYSPLPGIPYNNSGSGNVEMNRNQMEGVQPYFQNQNQNYNNYEERYDSKQPLY